MAKGDTWWLREIYVWLRETPYMYGLLREMGGSGRWVAKGDEFLVAREMGGQEIRTAKEGGWLREIEG